MVASSKLVSLVFPAILYASTALARPSPGGTAPYDTLTEDYARLNKPTLRDDLDYLDDGLMANLPSQRVEISQWDDAWMPLFCKVAAKSIDLDPRHFKTYNVKYDDCSEPWQICYHQDHGQALFELVDWLGRVPVGMRSWITEISALPQIRPGYFQAQNNGGPITISGGSPRLSVLIHEAAHGLDLLGALTGQHTKDISDDPSEYLTKWEAEHWYHRTDSWRKSFDADMYVPGRYADTNIVEDFAEVTVVSVFDNVVYGGFPGIEWRSRAIENQYKNVQQAAGNLIRYDPNARCTERLQPSEAVIKWRNGYTSAAQRRALAEKPDNRLSGNVTVIELKGPVIPHVCELSY